jgi:hypothetical protein
VRDPVSALVPAMAGADDALVELYGAAPEDFVAERKRLERSLRDQGQGAEADDIAGRRKPPLPVFVANSLARERAEDVAALIEAAEEVAAAHQAADLEQLRAAHDRLGDRVSGLVRAADEPGGQPLSAPMQQRLASLLRGAASDPDSAPLLRAGVLADEVAPSGFEALAGLTLAPRREPKPGTPQDEVARKRAAREEAARARVEELERELAAAQDDLASAEKSLMAAERDAQRARKRVDELTARLDRVRRSD